MFGGAPLVKGTLTRQRQRHDDAEAALGPVLGGHHPAHGLNVPPHNPQPQPEMRPVRQPPIRIGRRIRGADRDEPLEDALDLVGLDPRPLVGDRELGNAVARPCGAQGLIMTRG